MNANIAGLIKYNKNYCLGKNISLLLGRKDLETNCIMYYFAKDFFKKISKEIFLCTDAYLLYFSWFLTAIKIHIMNVWGQHKKL